MFAAEKYSDDFRLCEGGRSVGGSGVEMCTFAKVVEDFIQKKSIRS